MYLKQLRREQKIKRIIWTSLYNKIKKFDIVDFLEKIMNSILKFFIFLFEIFEPWTKAWFDWFVAKVVKNILYWLVWIVIVWYFLWTK